MKKIFLIIIPAVVLIAVFSLVYSQNEIKVQSFSNQIFSECGQNIDCTINSLRKISGDQDKKVVIQTFNDLISEYVKIEKYCHANAHHLSHFFYGYIGNVTEAISYVDRKCGGALYHGIVEQYFITQKLNSVSPDDIKISKICPESSMRFDVDRLECIHGIGHGLFEVYDFHVPDSLNRCNELESEVEQQRCGSGIFMKNQIEYNEKKEGFFDENDIFYPCNIIEEKYAAYCYNYQSSYILSKTNFSIPQSFTYCHSITPEKFVKFCYEGIGRQMSLAVFNDMNLGEIFCSYGQSSYQQYCHRGIAISFADHRNMEEAFQYCKIIPDNSKLECYSELGKWLGQIDSSKQFREEKCSMAENQEYQDICTSARTEDLRFLL